MQGVAFNSRKTTPSYRETAGTARPTSASLSSPWVVEVGPFTTMRRRCVWRAVHAPHAEAGSNKVANRPLRLREEKRFGDLNGIQRRTFAKLIPTDE